MRKILLVVLISILLSGHALCQPEEFKITGFITDSYFSSDVKKCDEIKTESRFEIMENNIPIAIASVTSINENGSFMRIKNGKEKINTTKIKNYKLRFLNYQPIMFVHSDIKPLPVLNIPEKVPVINAVEQKKSWFDTSGFTTDPFNGQPFYVTAPPPKKQNKIIRTSPTTFTVILNPELQREAFVKMCKERGWKYKSINGD